MIITLGNLAYPDSLEKGDILCVYPPFETDLRNILQKGGFTSDFTAKFNQRIRFLSERGINCILHPQWFEKMKYDPAQRLYSLRIQDKQNIRMLFLFIKKNHCAIPIFLCAFKEKDEKAYRKAAYTANKRLDFLIKQNYIIEEDIIIWERK